MTTVNTVSVGKKVVNTATTVLFTVPGGYAGEVKYYNITNPSGASENVDLYWTDSSASVNVYLLKAHTLAANASLNRTDAKLVLFAGDSMSLITDGTGSLDVTVTVELFIPAHQINL